MSRGETKLMRAAVQFFSIQETKLESITPILLKKMLPSDLTNSLPVPPEVLRVEFWLLGWILFSKAPFVRLTPSQSQ
jgi:hypothetical protein